MSYWVQVNTSIAPFLTISDVAHFTFTDEHLPLLIFPLSFDSTAGADPGFMTTTAADGHTSGDRGSSTRRRACFTSNHSPYNMNILNRWSPNPVPNGSWTTLMPMPQAVTSAAAVYYPPTNKIYVFGGIDPDSEIVYALTQIYDIASNTWSLGAPMPDVRNLMAGGYISATGRIYIISGDSNGSVQSAQPNTWAYDPVANTWTDLTPGAPFPHPAGGLAYGVVNNKLYIAGGRDANNQLINLTWEYEPTTNTYTQKADEPYSSQNNVPGSAVAAGRLWVFGGGNPFNPTGSSRCVFPSPPKSLPDRSDLFFPTVDDSGRYYDPRTDTWHSSPSLAVARSFPSGGAIGDNLLVAAGGYNGVGYNSRATLQLEDPCVGAPTLTSAASEKTHGAIGTFDVELPVSGTPGIECRSTGGTSDYTMVVTFSGNIIVTGSPQAQVTVGTGCVGTGGVCNGSVSVSENRVTVPLTNVGNAQTINVRINGVNNFGADAPAIDLTIPMSILIGDTNANATVNAADVAQTNARLGRPVDSTDITFALVNANGSINAADAAIVKQNSGNLAASMIHLNMAVPASIVRIHGRA